MLHFVLLSHLSSFHQRRAVTSATQHCSLVFFSCCVWCHPLTVSGKASSGSIYTPHRTRLLKMPLFPMVTFWQHTDMSWPHLIFWFPWVIQFYIEWYMSTSLLVFLFPFFSLLAEKHGFLDGNKSCSSQKGTTIDTPLQQDKNKKSQERRSSISLVYVARKVNAWWSRMKIRSLDVLYHGYVHIRGLKRNRYWSSRLAVLHCECCSVHCLGLWLCAQDCLWDPGRREILLPALQRNVTDSCSPLTEHR